MPTTDQLQTQLNALESKVSGIQSTVDTHSTSIHNLQVTTQDLSTRMVAAERLLEEHSRILQEHQEILEDHERRLVLIEKDTIDYAVIPLYANYRDMMLPNFDEEAGCVNIYMPPFTKDELREYNPDIQGLVEYKWYQKIFNPTYEQGSVTFDFDDSRDFLKSISLGPSSQISFPLPLFFKQHQPNRKLVIQSNHVGLVCTTQFIEYEKENLITLFNFTSVTINLQTSNPILKLVPVYGYQDSRFTQSDFTTE